MTKAWVDFDNLPEGITPEWAGFLMLSAAKKAGLTWWDGIDIDPVRYRAVLQLGLDDEDQGIMGGFGPAICEPIPLWDWIIWIANRGWEEKPKGPSAIEKLKSYDYRYAINKRETDDFIILRDAILELADRLETHG